MAETTHWASGLYVGHDTVDGLADCAQDVFRALGKDHADLVVIFVSSHFRSDYDQVSRIIREHIPSDTLIGCSAMGVIGNGEEVEDQSAISIMAASLPGAKWRGIYTDASDLPYDDSPQDEWKRWLGLSDVERADFILLADPFSAPVEQMVRGIDYAFPGSTLVGGLASAAGAARENALYLNDQVHREGMVGLALFGDVQLDAIVAQGCKPVGKPMTVTCCNENVIMELDGEQPVKVLEDLVPTLSEYDRTLIKTSLFIGLEMDPFIDEPGQGDFLIRNLIGVDYANGALAVGGALHEGQVVQFHLRDKQTSSHDLDGHLAKYQGGGNAGQADAALLFSCIGRGQNLYGTRNHDSDRFQSYLGDLPLSGFFCNGEIGPIGSSTYVHGYTSSFAIFRSRPTAAG